MISKLADVLYFLSLSDFFPFEINSLFSSSSIMLLSDFRGDLSSSSFISIVWLCNWNILVFIVPVTLRYSYLLFTNFEFGSKLGVDSGDFFLALLPFSPLTEALLSFKSFFNLFSMA